MTIDQRLSELESTNRKLRRIIVAAAFLAGGFALLGADTPVLSLLVCRAIEIRDSNKVVTTELTEEGNIRATGLLQIKGVDVMQAIARLDQRIEENQAKLKELEGKCSKPSLHVHSHLLRLYGPDIVGDPLVDMGGVRVRLNDGETVVSPFGDPDAKYAGKRILAFWYVPSHGGFKALNNTGGYFGPCREGGGLGWLRGSAPRDLSMVVTLFVLYEE